MFILLQTQGGANNLNEVVAESLKFSKAINDLGALTVMAGVLLTLVMIMFGFFIYQLFQNQKQLTQLTKSSEITLNYFSDKSKREINISQAKSLVHNSNLRLRYTCIIQVIKIITENNIEDREKVTAKIDQFLANLFSSHNAYFQKFDFEGVALASLVDSSWVDRVRKQMDCDTSTHDYEIYKLEEVYGIIFGSQENALEEKLTSLSSNKI